MEGLQGPTTNNNNTIPFYRNVESLERGKGDLNCNYEHLLNTEKLSLEEEEQAPPYSLPSLQDKMPFLQMLQSVDSPPFSPFTEPHFKVLLTLQQQQHKKPWERKYLSEMESRTQHAVELESCITHDISEAHSPVKSETRDRNCPNSTSCPEVVSSSLCNGEANSPHKCKNENTASSSMVWFQNQNSPKSTTGVPKPPPPVGRERKKRKRTRPSKNKEEVESQRMTHIAVERNRRRQMNDHLNALRTLMPTSFIQRGDQASIIGGAIDFVKELEQLLQSLEAQKRMRNSKDDDENEGEDRQQQHQHKFDSIVPPFNVFFTSPQYTTYSSLIVHDSNNHMEDGGGRGRWDDRDEFTSENKWGVADIEVIVIQTHVNLKILSPRRPGQLLRAIAALEDLRLTILHLNITSFHSSVLYSFNLKIEDECKLGSADEIAAAVYQIFSYIN